MEEFDEKDTDNVSFGGRAGAVSARKRRDSYDYFDAVQMLGRYHYINFMITYCFTPMLSFIGLLFF